MSAINDLKETNDRMKINTTLNLDQLRGNIVDTLDKLGESAASRTSAALKSFSRTLAALAEEGERVEREQKILQSLVFESMKQREEEIKDAHKLTLTWIFKNKETRFADWLAAESGIYWVKGKVSNHFLAMEAFRINVN